MDSQQREGDPQHDVGGDKLASVVESLGYRDQHHVGNNDVGEEDHDDPGPPPAISKEPAAGIMLVEEGTREGLQPKSRSKCDQSPMEHKNNNKHHGLQLLKTAFFFPSWNRELHKGKA